MPLPPNPTIAAPAPHPSLNTHTRPRNLSPHQSRRPRTPSNLLNKGSTRYHLDDRGPLSSRDPPHTHTHRSPPSCRPEAGPLARREGCATFRLAVRTKLVILLQQQVGQDRLVPIHVLHRFARHSQGAGGGRGRRALLAPRNPGLSPKVRTPGPRPGAPPENEGALSPCPSSAPSPVSRARPPTLQPPQSGAPWRA